jgi:hypothetical protein
MAGGDLFQKFPGLRSGSTIDPKMTPEVEVPSDPQPPRMSEAARLSGVYFEPTKTFEDIAARPTFLVPLLLVLVMSLVYLFLFSQHVGWERMLRQQMETSSRATQLPPEQREAQMRIGLKFAPVGGFLGVLIGMPVGYLLWAAILLGIVKGILSAPVRFKQVFAVISYAGMPGLLMTLLAIVVMYLKSPDDFNLSNPLVFNPGALLDRTTTSKFLYSLVPGCVPYLDAGAGSHRPQGRRRAKALDGRRNGRRIRPLGCVDANRGAARGNDGISGNFLENGTRSRCGRGRFVALHFLPLQDDLLAVRRGDGDEAESHPGERILPANLAGSRIQAEKFALRGREQIRALADDIHEIATLQFCAPHFLAGHAIERHDGPGNADIQQVGLGHWLPPQRAQTGMVDTVIPRSPEAFNGCFTKIPGSTFQAVTSNRGIAQTAGTALSTPSLV